MRQINRGLFRFATIQYGNSQHKYLDGLFKMFGRQYMGVRTVCRSTTLFQTPNNYLMD